MTVKELIEQLQKFNPETEVMIEVTDPTDFTYQNPIEFDLRLGDRNWDEDDDEGNDFGDNEPEQVVIINGGDC